MNRRDRLLARWCGLMPVRATLARLGDGRSFVALNYHRIGYADRTDFDPGVFTVTPEEFEAQVAFLRRRCAVVSMEQTIEALETGRPLPRNAVLITFDDGYLDNFQTAFPILAQHGLPATFFLVTSMVGGNVPPWWDRIASLVRHARRRQFTLTVGGRSHSFDLDRLDLPTALRRVLTLCKLDPRPDQSAFIEEVEAATGAAAPQTAATRLFLDWTEAAEMVRGGMTIGSHTVTHRLLARLDRASQEAETANSRAILSERLQAPIDAFAYPVGRETAFSNTSIEAVRKAGYRIAFSFCGGINHVDTNTSRFDLRRLDPGNLTPIGVFRGRLAMASFFGR